MQGCKVSVVITTYKRPASIIRRAIDSVINQSVLPNEIILINDYPEDGKLANEIKSLVATYNGRVAYYDTCSNSGACYARNIGLKFAKGEYIGFLDDDDEWLENKLESQLLGFNNEDIGLVYTPYYREDHGKKTICGNACSNDYTDLLLRTNPMALFPLMRTEYVKRINGFDINLPSSQDRDLILRLSLICKFNYVDIPTAIYHVTDESISTNIEKKKKGFSMFVDKHMELYRKYPKAYNFQMMKMTNNMIVAGEFGFAHKCWLHGVKTRPLSISNIIEPTKGVFKKVLRKNAFH